MCSRIPFAVDDDEAPQGVAPVVACYARKWGAYVRVLHVHPSVASALVQAAERVGADLVVLGSRRPSDAGGPLLGSVAHQVSHRLRCPVLLGRRVAARESVR